MGKEITIAKYKENKRVLETRIKEMLEAFQKDNGVIVSEINYCNDIVYLARDDGHVRSDITISLGVKI